MPPPVKVFAEAPVMLIVPVPVMETFVPLVFHAAAPVAAVVHVPEPIATVLTSVPEEACILAELRNVTLYPFAFKVPEFNVIPDDALLTVKLSCKVTEPDAPTVMLNGCVNVMPALVIVWAVLNPLKNIMPVPLSVVPVPLIQLP